MSAETEKSDNAWTEKCTLTSLEVLSLEDPDGSMKVIKGSLIINDLLSDFKASLREEIEKHLKDVRKEFDACTDEEGLREEEIELSARIDSLKWILQLLDTVKPKEEKKL